MKRYRLPGSSVTSLMSQVSAGGSTVVTGAAGLAASSAFFASSAAFASAALASSAFFASSAAFLGSGLLAGLAAGWAGFAGACDDAVGAASVIAAANPIARESIGLVLACFIDPLKRRGFGRLR